MKNIQLLFNYLRVKATILYTHIQSNEDSKQLVYFDLIKQFLTQFVYESHIFTSPKWKPIEFDMSIKMHVWQTMSPALYFSPFLKNKTFLNDAFVMYKAAIMFHLSTLLLFLNVIHGIITKKLRNTASNVVSMYRVPTGFEANLIDSYRKFFNSLIYFQCTHAS